VTVDLIEAVLSGTADLRPVAGGYGCLHPESCLERGNSTPCSAVSPFGLLKAVLGWLAASGDQSERFML